MVSKKVDGTDQLSQELQHLTAEIRLHNSLSHRFIQGLVTGVSTALGATLVASLLILFLSRVIKTIEDVPILNNVLDSASLDQLINPSEKE